MPQTLDDAFRDFMDTDEDDAGTCWACNRGAFYAGVHAVMDRLFSNPDWGSKEAHAEFDRVVAELHAYGLEHAEPAGHG